MCGRPPAPILQLHHQPAPREVNEVPTIPHPASLLRRRPAEASEEQQDRRAADERIIDRSVMIVAASLALLMTIALAVVISKVSSGSVATAAPAASATGGPSGDATPIAAAPAGSSDEPAEEFSLVDPRLPAVPEGDVKKFRVDVFEHTTKVSDDLPATRVWSYGVNSELLRGSGASTPMVVTEGDEVEITLVNGADESMDVQFPHSVDYHSSEVAPNKAFATIAPGETHEFRFTADHPGVFMYHCATAPVLMHTGAGMVGTMIVKPKDLAPADHEFWITQQEFYLGPNAGDNADLAKMKAKEPDAITFNGYSNQYEKHPIEVQPGEKVRLYVLNAGPSIWSAFHVIGTVFDRTVIEGTVGEHVQTVNLAPSQGGWVEFTLAEDGSYPFVTHAFGDMVKGAVGVFAAGDAPAGGGH